MQEYLNFLKRIFTLILCLSLYPKISHSIESPSPFHPDESLNNDDYEIPSYLKGETGVIIKTRELNLCVEKENPNEKIIGIAQSNVFPKVNQNRIQAFEGGSFVIIPTQKKMQLRVIKKNAHDILIQGNHPFFMCSEDFPGRVQRMSHVMIQHTEENRRTYVSENQNCLGTQYSKIEKKLNRNEILLLYLNGKHTRSKADTYRKKFICDFQRLP